MLVDKSDLMLFDKAGPATAAASARRPEAKQRVCHCPDSGAARAQIALPAGDLSSW